MKNILIQTLELLKVKFTKAYTTKLYNEYPYKDSLFGVSKILSTYNVDNEGLKFNNKNELPLVETPFISKIENKLGIITKLTDQDVFLTWENRDIVIPLNDFLNIWDGNMLSIKSNNQSIEPKYKEHRYVELFDIAQKYMLGIAVGILFLVGFVTNNIHAHLGIMLSLIVNSIGIYIGYLLIQKQLHIHNKLSNKICSIFKTSNCDSVLDSPASRLFGLIGWSEVGLGYFVSNILILTLFPNLISYLALINMCALPYSFWSVWYQKFKVNQWCPLCLIVQLLLWTVFIVNVIFGYVSIPLFAVTNILIIGCIYSIPFVTINLLLPLLGQKGYLQIMVGRLNNLIMKDEVFSALLKENGSYNINHDTSLIQWGNKKADTIITVATNPHCGACATMHKRIEQLLEKHGDDLCVQYIFSSFSEKMDRSSIFLILIYLYSKLSIEEKKVIYNEWFEWGRHKPEEFIEKYKVDFEDIRVKEEFEKHKNWSKTTKIDGTPTIFINGYELPDEYEIEDISDFIPLGIL